MTKYLVTGSAGFIGFYITKALLERNEEVVGIDNLNPYYIVKLKKDRNSILKDFSNYSFYKLDLASRENLYTVLDKEKPKIICHLAAQAGVRYSFENPFAYEQSNLLGFLNLIEWAKKNTENFVYASSSSVYGNNKKIPFSEIDRVDNPTSLYAATKKANELIAYAYHNLFELPITGLRFFSIYGPWGRPDMALYKFAEKIIKEKPIDVYGYGKMKRDFSYVEDIVPPVLKTLDTPRKYEIYNLGRSNPVELLYFISLIEKELGIRAKKEFLPIQPGEVPETYADTTKAQKELDFEPRTSIEDGVKAFVKWFKNYQST